MTTLVLARHGETDWNRDRRIQGHADTPLNDTGRAQARELGRALASIDLVAAYSSDLSRARETAEIAVAGRGIEIITLPELRERSFGSWEGLRDGDVPARFPEEYARWRNGDGDGAPDAEPHETLLERVRRAVLRIAAEHPDGNVLVVSHGGPLRVVHALAHRLDYLEHRHSIPWVKNCALSHWAVHDGVLTPAS